MNTLLKADIAALLLRIGLGLILIVHSLYLKLVVFTLPGTAQFFISLGLPGPLAYLVFAIESISGIALLLGLKVRLFALLALPVMLGASWAHSGNGWLFTNNGGGWEYPLLLSLLCLVQLILGNGRYALNLKQED